MALLNKDTSMNLADWRQFPYVRELLRGVSAHIDPRAEAAAAAVSKRRYQRTSVRKFAVCIDGERQLAAYAKDISRTGVGFYCTSGSDLHQLVDLWLPHGEALALRVVRCRKLTEHCYEVGTVFRGDSTIG
jgi:hypothetical protein